MSTHSTHSAPPPNNPNLFTHAPLYPHQYSSTDSSSLADEAYFIDKTNLGVAPASAPPVFQQFPRYLPESVVTPASIPIHAFSQPLYSQQSYPQPFYPQLQPYPGPELRGSFAFSSLNDPSFTPVRPSFSWPCHDPAIQNVTVAPLFPAYFPSNQAFARYPSIDKVSRPETIGTTSQWIPVESSASQPLSTPCHLTLQQQPLHRTSRPRRLPLINHRLSLPLPFRDSVDLPEAYYQTNIALALEALPTPPRPSIEQTRLTIPPKVDGWIPSEQRPLPPRSDMVPRQLDTNPHLNNYQNGSRPTQLSQGNVEGKEAEAAEWLQNAGNLGNESLLGGATERVIETTSLPEGQGPTTPLLNIVEPAVSVLRQEDNSSVDHSSELVSEEGGKKRQKVGDMTVIVTDIWDID